MNKLKKGDQVQVIAGKDKGKIGTIISIERDDKVIVEGVNIARKHVKPNPNAGVQGGIIDKTMPIHVSNVMYYDGKERTRVGIRTLKDGQRVRFAKSSDEAIDLKA